MTVYGFTRDGGERVVEATRWVEQRTRTDLPINRNRRPQPFQGGAGGNGAPRSRAGIYLCKSRAEIAPDSCDNIVTVYDAGCPPTAGAGVVAAAPWANSTVYADGDEVSHEALDDGVLYNWSANGGHTSNADPPGWDAAEEARWTRGAALESVLRDVHFTWITEGQPISDDMELFVAQVSTGSAWPAWAADTFYPAGSRVSHAQLSDGQLYNWEAPADIQAQPDPPGWDAAHEAEWTRRNRIGSVYQIIGAECQDAGAPGGGPVNPALLLPWLLPLLAIPWC